MEEKVVFLTNAYAVLCDTSTSVRDDGVLVNINKVGKIIPLSDFFEESTPVLPKNTRIHICRNGVDWFLIEEPPARRNITVVSTHNRELTALRNEGKLELYRVPEILKKDINQKVKLRLNLNFPRIIYLIGLRRRSILGWELKSMFVVGSLKEFTSLRDAFIHLPLPNINTSSGVCLGNIPPLTNMDASKAVKILINSFWTNEFNSDYSDGFELYLNNPNKNYIRGWFSWQYFSNPDLGHDFQDENWESWPVQLDTIINNTEEYSVNNIEYPFYKNMVMHDGRFFVVTNKSSIKIKNLIFHVNQKIRIDNMEVTLLSVLNCKENIYLRFMRNDGTTFPQLLTEKLIEKIHDALMNHNVLNEMESLEFAGKKIEKKKMYRIITTADRELLVYVDTIRKVADNFVEVVCNNRQLALLASAIKEVEALEFNGLRDINNEEIEIGESCVVITRGNVPLKRSFYTKMSYNLKFDNNSIYFCFKGDDYLNDILIPLNERDFIVVKNETWEKEARLVEIYLDQQQGRLITSNENYQFIKYFNDGYVNNARLHGITPPTSQVMEAIEKQIATNELNIPVNGNGRPLHIKVGGTYIVPDWEHPDPEKVFEPKKVIGFECNKKTNKVSVVVTDIGGEETYKIPIFHKNLIVNGFWEAAIDDDPKFKIGQYYKIRTPKGKGRFRTKQLKAIVSFDGRKLGLFNDLTTHFLDSDSVEITSARTKIPTNAVVSPPPSQVGDWFVVSWSTTNFYPEALAYKADNKHLMIVNDAPYLIKEKEVMKKRFGIPLPRGASHNGSSDWVFVAPDIFGRFTICKDGANSNCPKILFENAEIFK